MDKDQASFSLAWSQEFNRQRTSSRLKKVCAGLVASKIFLVKPASNMPNVLFIAFIQ